MLAVMKTHLYEATLVGREARPDALYHNLRASGIRFAHSSCKEVNPSE